METPLWLAGPLASQQMLELRHVPPFSILPSKRMLSTCSSQPPAPPHDHHARPPPPRACQSSLVSHQASARLCAQHHPIWARCAGCQPSTGRSSSAESRLGQPVRTCAYAAPISTMWAAACTTIWTAQIWGPSCRAPSASATGCPPCSACLHGDICSVQLQRLHSSLPRPTLQACALLRTLPDQRTGRSLQLHSSEYGQASDSGFSEPRHHT